MPTATVGPTEETAEMFDEAHDPSEVECRPGVGTATSEHARTASFAQRAAGMRATVDLVETDPAAADTSWFTTRSPGQRGSAVDWRAGFVNGMSASYPELPFSGTRDSGFGREPSGAGRREYCDLKTAWHG